MGDPRPVLAYGPWLGWRWWRLAAGVCLGLCTGTKWSGLFFLVAFGLLTRVLGPERPPHCRHPVLDRGGILKDGMLAFASIVPVAAVTYLATWTGWFLSSDAYDRNWAKTNPGGAWGWVPDSLRSLWHYHLTAYDFHPGSPPTTRTRPTPGPGW